MSRPYSIWIRASRVPGRSAVRISRTGRYRLAETAIRQALTAHTDQHGPEHPDTLSSRGSLAVVLGGMGRLEEAEAEHRAVLEACVQVLCVRTPHLTCNNASPTTEHRTSCRICVATTIPALLPNPWVARS
jgi:hypothetical protein